MRCHRFFYHTLISCLPFICSHKKDRLFPHGVWRWIKEMVPARGLCRLMSKVQLYYKWRPTMFSSEAWLFTVLSNWRQRGTSALLYVTCVAAPWNKSDVSTQSTLECSVMAPPSHALKSCLSSQTSCKEKLHLWQISTLKNQTPGLSIPPCAELSSGYCPANGWQVHFSRISAFRSN